MLNPIHAIRQLYQLEATSPSVTGLSRDLVEQQEAALGLVLPPMLYHYLIELGAAYEVNHAYHQLLTLPLTQLGEHLVIGKTCDKDAVWGIARKDLTQPNTNANPMVQMSRNFDAIDVREVHWFDELPLAEFLLAQAITNGVNGGLAYHAALYEFDERVLPINLGDKLAQYATEIIALRQPHERYFQHDDYALVMVVGLDGDQPNAFLVGSQDGAKFHAVVTALALDFAS